MVWLEIEQNLCLVAQILMEAKRPTHEMAIRKRFNLSIFNTDVIVGALIHHKLLKVYGNAPAVQNRILVTSQKGHEFLRRFRKLLQLLDLDLKDVESLDTCIHCE